MYCKEEFIGVLKLFFLPNTEICFISNLVFPCQDNFSELSLFFKLVLTLRKFCLTFCTYDQLLNSKYVLCMVRNRKSFKNLNLNRLSTSMFPV